MTVVKPNQDPHVARRGQRWLVGITIETSKDRLPQRVNAVLERVFTC
jgi:hypothetical protein